MTKLFIDIVGAEQRQLDFSGRLYARPARPRS